MVITGTSISTTLQDNLRSAMAAELTTIPAYLYAYWSIKPIDDGGSKAGLVAAKTIMSVILEEMLHMGLVSNILNSLGGVPSITASPYLPEYPCYLLRSPDTTLSSVDVKLQRLSQASMENFLAIELPEDKEEEGYTTLGKFYDEFISPLLPQGSDYTYGKQLPTWDNPGVGQLIQIASYDDASRAVELILAQGEGLNEGYDDGEHELAHYWKFYSVQKAIDHGLLNLNTDVYQVIDNPDASLYNAAQQQANLAFNSTYSNLLDALQNTFTSSEPDVFYASTTLMEMLNRQAAVLRNTGTVTVSSTNYLPGPTFEYVPVNQRITE